MILYGHYLYVHYSVIYCSGCQNIRSVFRVLVIYNLFLTLNILSFNISLGEIKHSSCKASAVVAKYHGTKAPGSPGGSAR